MLVVLLLAGGVAGLLAFNTSMQQNSFTATALQHQADALAAREQSLAMDLERLRDPQQLAARAKKLGMVPPTNPAFVRLSDGKVLGQPARGHAARRRCGSTRCRPAKPKVLAPKPRIVKVEGPARRKNAAETEVRPRPQWLHGSGRRLGVRTQSGGQETNR